jgi:hypothetical protein
MKKEQKYIAVDIDRRWGLLTDEDLQARAAWGGRTIAERNYDGKHNIIYVSDRITMMGTESDINKICKFLEMAKTRRALGKFVDQVGTASSQVLTLTSPHGFVLKATPNASYGYLYIKVIWNNPTL